ncbi:hypothetical protein [Maritalea sp. S77]|uniref:hypothetical protein n=1 Tax=Maritalea sp. S77 TaxID=3415125 RepID=UPI003C7AC3BD
MSKIGNETFYEYQKSIETITEYGVTQKRLQRALQVTVDILNREMDGQDFEDFDNGADVLFETAAEFADVSDDKIAEFANIDIGDLDYFREFGFAQVDSDDPFVLAEPLGHKVGQHNFGTVQDVAFKIFSALQSIVDDFHVNETDELDSESASDVPEVADTNEPSKTISRWVVNPLHKFENQLAYKDFVVGLEKLIADLEESKSFANSENVAEARRQHLVGLVETVLKLLDAPMIDAELVKTGKSEFEKFGDDLKEETKSAVKKGIVKQGMNLLGEIAKFLLGSG